MSTIAHRLLLGMVWEIHGNDDISQAWGWQHSISQSEMAIMALR